MLRPRCLNAVLFLVCSVALQTLLSLPSRAAEVAISPDVRQRFEWLSKNGNSDCSFEFLKSIAKMPASARLQGSCCSEMDLHHYAEQIAGLKRFSGFPEIPADPYNIEAPLAQQAMAAYGMELTPKEQASYNYAMTHADEKGPCCCQCWRWHAYGGLAKLLIRNHDFNGTRIVQVWDLSDGCGGADHT